MKPIRRFLCWLWGAIRDQHNLPHFLIAAFTLLLVIFAYSAWRESIRTTAALEEQIKVLKEGDRPFLYDTAVSPPTFSPQFKRILWNFVFMNYGKSIAYNTRVRSYIKIGDEPFRPSEGPQRQFGAPEDLPPGKPLAGTAASREGFTEEYLAALLKQDVAMGLLIEFEYWDASLTQKYTGAVCIHMLASGATLTGPGTSCPKEGN
jgi:hypothetical protein